MTQENTAPGNANLPIGSSKSDASTRREEAYREIGVPRGGEANREGGVPRYGVSGEEDDGEGRWRSRGYLPHFDKAERAQHVTFHLSDSLPWHVLKRMEEELRGLPEDRRDVERRRKVESWLDAGHGSCVLRVPEVARKVQEALLFFDGQRYRLIAWVIMPNHVHTLFEPLPGWSLNKIVASWKKFTARMIRDYERAHPGNGPGNANLPIGIFNTANQEIGVPRGDVPRDRVWHREFWDRYVRDERHFERVVEYIHGNPVTAGLVKVAEDWPWGSAGMIGRANREIGVPREETNQGGDGVPREETSQGGGGVPGEEE